MSKQILDESIFLSNIRSFIHDNIAPKFKKNATKTLDKLLICKEDKEQLTKSKITLIIGLFEYLNVLDEKALQRHVAHLEKGSGADFKVFDFAL